MYKLVLLGYLLTLFACVGGGETKLDDGASKQVSKTPKITIKDRSKPLGLHAAVPVAFAKTGWAITKNTDPTAVPAHRPATNEVFYAAEKLIDGRKRVVSVVYGNLLAEEDAIVNAANSGLEGGGGIDGAIHNAAMMNGQDMMKDEAIAYKKFHNLTSFPVGAAMAMNAYGLNPKIKMVVFTVGPQGASDAKKNLELFSAAYNSLAKANEYGARNVSLPLISTGIFGFPEDIAAELFFKAILKYFDDHPSSNLESVRLVDFGQGKVATLGQKFRLAFTP